MSIQLTENARKVLEARYLRRDPTGQTVETPDELFESVARAVAHAELLLGSARRAAFWETRFHELLSSLDFLPNSPTLMNAGKVRGQLSACFVLPVQDSMEGVFDALKQMAIIQRTGGGTGFSFSSLPPRGDPVQASTAAASGPVSFIRIFDCATENIKQGGKRSGANMGVLHVEHPDIREFIQAKHGESDLRNFNFSVGVTDAFMAAAQRKEMYNLTHPSGTAAGTESAGEVFAAISKAAWQTGDPGLLFLDAIDRCNPIPHLGRFRATNPCGEIPLLPYESCNLGSVNLAHMVKDDNGVPSIDWEHLRTTVEKAVRFLDDVIQINQYPIAEIEQITLANRKIGLGVMGFAEMLIKLGISYDSDQALDQGEKVMKTIARNAEEASRRLGNERGSFPNWQGSLYHAKGIPMRNATKTAIAPTGTIAIIAGTTPSIEPLFALAYRRSQVLKGEPLFEGNSLFIQRLEQNHLQVETIMREVLKKGRLESVEGLPDPLCQCE